jgi:hypothetical protein
MSKTGRLARFDWNWRGAIVGLLLLAVLAGDLALFGETLGGYAGAVVIVLASALVLRFEIGPDWLHHEARPSSDD